MPQNVFVDNASKLLFLLQPGTAAPPVLQETTATPWTNALREFDVVLVQGSGVMAFLEGLYAKLFKEGSAPASHSCLLKEPPKITEADWPHVQSNYLARYLNNHCRVWIFRADVISADAAIAMRNYIRAAEETQADYSGFGIIQYGLAYFRKLLTGKVAAFKDKHGVFCSEYTSLVIVAGALPYVMSRPPAEIDPTYQLNWFLQMGIQGGGWKLVGQFDKGKYALCSGK